MSKRFKIILAIIFEPLLVVAAADVVLALVNA
jgi:hypothetical protein